MDTPLVFNRARFYVDYFLLSSCLNEFGIVIKFMVNGAVNIKKYFFELFTSRNVNEKSTSISV